MKHSATPATGALDALGLRYSIHKFESTAKDHFGREAAEAVGREFSAEQVFKTILFSHETAIVVAVSPVGHEISAKKLASAAGLRSLMPTRPEVAQRVSGYVVGGISPLGQKKSHLTVIDESAWLFPTILVSGGRRGLEIEISPDALRQATSAIIAQICALSS